MKITATIIIITVMTLHYTPPATGQFDVSSIVASLSKMPLRDKVLFIVDIIGKQPLYDELENIFIAGYELLHEEPTLEPEIMHNLVQWALDELPYLLTNQTFKDSFHIFVREINKVDINIAPQTSLDAFMNGIFAQMDWFGVVGQILSKILEAWFTKHGVKPEIANVTIPSTVAKVEHFAKLYGSTLIPLLVDLLSDSPSSNHVTPVLFTPKTTPKALSNTTRPAPSIIDMLQNTNNQTAKLMIIYKFLMNNEPLLNKMQNILIAGIPLLTEQPTLRSELLTPLLSWGLQKFPVLLRNPLFKESYHFLVTKVNAANTTGLNVTNEIEFTLGILGQIDWIDIVSKIASKLAVPFSISLGANKEAASKVFPQLFMEIKDFLKQNMEKIVKSIVISMGKIDDTQLQNEAYVDRLIFNLLQNSIVKPVIPKLLDDHPGLLTFLQNILLSGIPLVEPLSTLDPDVRQILIHWAIDGFPKLLENQLIKQALKVIVMEIKSVNLTEFNSTEETFGKFLLSHLDIIHIIREVAVPLAVSSSQKLGLKPEVSVYMVPFLLQQLEQLTKTDLMNVMKVLITEMNKVNTTDLNSQNSTIFITEFLNRLSIRNIVGSLVSQPKLKGFLSSTLMKSPQIVLDLGKMMLSSFSISDILSLPSTASQSSVQCYSEVLGFLGNLIGGSNWAKKMFDAYGKPPTGTLTGNLHFIGSYDECLALNDMEYDSKIGSVSPSSKARYCRATFRLSESLINATVGLVNTFGVPVSLTWGMCVFSSCRSEEIPILFRLGILEQFDLKPDSVVCSGEAKDFSKDKAAVAITAIMITMFVLVLVATVIHGVIRSMSKHNSPLRYSDGHAYTNNAFDSGPFEKGVLPMPFNYLKNGSINHSEDPAEKTVIDDKNEDIIDDEGIGTRIISAFSLFTNMRTTLSFDRKTDDVTCVHGIRFLSIVMIAVGNAYLYNATWPAISDSSVVANQLAGLDVLKRFTFQFVMASTLATDTFLMLSGFLITYKLLSCMAKKEEVRVLTLLKFLLQRFIRLTPVYIVIMMSYAFMYTYIGDGPTWPSHIELAETCRDRWWYHILYVNNLVGHHGLTAFQQCMPWSWFNAVIMQLNFITPILIVLFLFSNRLGFSIVVLLMAGGMTATGVKEHKYGGDIMSSLTDSGNYWNYVFTAPWCRVPSYCIGVMLAYIMFIRVRARMDLLVAVVGWIISIVLGVFLLYVTYLKYMEGAPEWTLPEQAAFESLSRPAWSACVAWLIFACHYHRGGIFNTILSWRGFIPLSRLTYTIYLLNPVVIAVYVMSRRSLVYVSDIDMAFLIVSYLVVTIMGALLLSVVFERPFLSLEKALKKKSEVKLFLGKDA